MGSWLEQARLGAAPSEEGQHPHNNNI